MGSKKEPTIDDLFVSIQDILNQTEHEEKFIGHILCLFAKIENLMARIISTHNTPEENYWKYLLKVANELWTAQKITKLTEILTQENYPNKTFDYDDLIKNLENLKDIRNQLAHNIINPHESDKHAKEQKCDISLLIIRNGKIENKSFGLQEQNELDDALNHVYSHLKGVHRFVKKQKKYKELEWYP